MTSQEKDKFICEKLGVCWHEWFDHKCKNCDVLDSVKNNDFVSDSGRVQLLKLLYYKMYLGVFIAYIELDDENIHRTLKLLIDDTGLFRDAVYKWLGGEE